MNVQWASLVLQMVHDVRTLVRQALSNAQLLEREIGEGLNPEAAERLHKVIEAQRDLNQLITRIGILADADQSSVPPADDMIDLDCAILSAKLQWKAALGEAGAELVVGEVPQCKVPPRMQTVLSELIGNSLRHRNPDRPLRVAIEARESGGELQVEVQDNGPAWNPAHTDKLFRPLSKLNARAGFSLGLPIARAMVEAAGGRISGEAKPSGARFVIELPLRPA